MNRWTNIDKFISKQKGVWPLPIFDSPLIVAESFSHTQFCYDSCVGKDHYIVTDIMTCHYATPYRDIWKKR